MVHYKLTYFDLRGLGEVVRLVFHYANVKFDDIRITQEKWPELKPNTPYGQLPMLEVDGVQIAQTYAIARFLARRFDLAGEDDIESALLDSIADLQKDFQVQAQPYFQVASGRKEGDKEKLHKEVFVPAVEHHLPLLVRALEKTGSGFFGKKGPTWVDFYVANATFTAKGFSAAEFAKYPEIEKHSARVHSLPQLKNYLSTRKETQF